MYFIHVHQIVVIRIHWESENIVTSKVDFGELSAFMIPP